MIGTWINIYMKYNFTNVFSMVGYKAQLVPYEVYSNSYIPIKTVIRAKFFPILTSLSRKIGPQVHKFLWLISLRSVFRKRWNFIQLKK